PVPVSTTIRVPPASISSRLSRQRSRPRSSVWTRRLQSGFGTTPKKPPASGRNQPARTTRTLTPPAKRRASSMTWSGSVMSPARDAGALEVGVEAAGGRIGLAAVARAEPGVAVADLDRGREALEADLPDL